MTYTNKLYIMRGLPGSGKSTTSKQLRDIHTYYLSTDTYWYRPDGIYDFNFKLLGQAHQHTFNQFKAWVELCISTGFMYSKADCILDNTNIQFKDFEKYLLELDDRFTVYYCYPNTDWATNVDECFKRNTHNVPKETIQKMLDKWESHDIIVEKTKKLGLSNIEGLF